MQGAARGGGELHAVSGRRLKAGQQPREAPPREAEDLLKVRTRAQAVRVAPQLSRLREGDGTMVRVRVRVRVNHGGEAGGRAAPTPTLT